jgi:Ca-activated chloride channel family protein
VSFQAPLFLAGLALLPLGALAYRERLRRRQRYAVRFPGVGVLAGVLPRTPSWRRHAPAALLALALAGLIVALARPQTTVAVPVQRASVMLVTDASRSMEAADVAPTRLEAARRAANHFLDRVPRQVRVGIVGFSDTPYTIARPTTDRGAVREVLDALEADGGTATGDAVTAALEALRPPGHKQRTPAAIVLLSDGKATAGSDPIEAARAAGRLKVPIYTVALGTPEGTVPGPFGAPQPVPPDPETLQAMSKVSGGRAFTVEDAGQLNSIYQKLGSRLGTRKQHRQITAGFAAAGLAALLAAAGASLRWFARLP